MRITVVGLGLIGGSLAKAIKHYTGHTVIGCDLNSAVCKSALSGGAVDEITDFCPDADIYFLCMDPEAVCHYLREHIDQFPPGCIISDVCGIKRSIADCAVPLCRAHGLHYIGGHPMAGREVSSFYNSDFTLFENRSYLLAVEDNTDRAALKTLEDLIYEFGVSGVKYTTPDEHDRMIAFTSQLPHIIAGAYVKSPNCMRHEGFSAGSYHDVSRVATVDETLWTELFLQNKENLLEELQGMIFHLQMYQSAIEKEDRERLCTLIRESRQQKEKDRRLNGAEKPHKFG